MKITLARIKNMEKSLNKIIGQDTNIKSAFKLARILKMIEGELKNVEEFRIKLINKYGTKDPKTEEIIVNKDNVQIFYKELNELLQTEIDIDFSPVSCDEIGDIKISAIDASVLDGIII
ncbi:MAG: hypothetical protein WC942_07930 [Clostridia bacterium]|jgi:hypothetical protein